MVGKVTGFLMVEGWTGVATIYLWIGLGSFIGVGAFWFIVFYQKEDMPKRREVKDYLKRIVKYLVLLTIILSL